MPSPGRIAAGQPVHFETPERFWPPLAGLLTTVGLTVISFITFGIVWQGTGFEMLIVGMGWAHVLLGFAFFFGKVLRGEPNYRQTFVFLLFVTLSLWALHYAIDLTFVIYAYFLFHAFRDEVMIYFQRSSHHRSKMTVYALRGLIPAILLLLSTAQPQAFRQDLRRVELTGSEIQRDGWTAVSFEPVPDSAGKDFYFYIQAPQSKTKAGFLAPIVNDARVPEGEVRLGDNRYVEGDLIFKARYEDDAPEPAAESLPSRVGTVELAGNNRVGQTFVAERDGLSGFWLRTTKTTDADPGLGFLFRLATPPLLPLESPLNTIRSVLIWALAAVFLWQIAPNFLKNWKVWVYLSFLALLLVIAQQIIKPAQRLGYVVPMIFQLIVVFHYFSWYVFSFSKFNTFKGNQISIPKGASWYDQFLWKLRQPSFFTRIVVILNVVSFAGVFWYYLGNAPDVMKYAFNYNYFLYFLIFHVTFSFNPKLPSL